MARPLRVDIEDGWYHVTARGDHRQVIFCDHAHCTGLSLAEVGRKAGGMDDAAVTMAVRRFPLACQRDKLLAKLSASVVKAVQL